MSLPSAVDIVADRSYDQTPKLIKVRTLLMGKSKEEEYKYVSLNGGGP